jgi:hypothetical protein
MKLNGVFIPYPLFFLSLILFKYLSPSLISPVYFSHTTVFPEV